MTWYDIFVIWKFLAFTLVTAGVVILVITKFLVFLGLLSKLCRDKNDIN